MKRFTKYYLFYIYLRVFVFVYLENENKICQKTLKIWQINSFDYKVIYLNNKQYGQAKQYNIVIFVQCTLKLESNNNYINVIMSIIKKTGNFCNDTKNKSKGNHKGNNIKINEICNKSFIYIEIKLIY